MSTSSAASVPSGSTISARSTDLASARRFHRPLDAVHVVGYFAPETTEAYVAAGLSDYAMGYFASRSAAMGAVSPGVTTATFYVFAPRLVEYALPKAWSLASPQEILAARYRGIEAALRRGLGNRADSPEVREAAELGHEAITGLDVAGRPLCGGHLSLPETDVPVLALWRAATILREHRGDGHVAALLTAGLDPVEALVTAAASGGPAKFLKTTRGWTPEEWAAGEDRLRGRGLLGDDGALTEEGAAVRAAVEAATDTAAQAPYTRLGADRAARLLELVRPLAAAIGESGLLPASVAGSK